MAGQTRVWWKAVDAVWGYRELRALHRADGRVTPEEDAAEEAYVAEQVVPAVGNTAECMTIGFTVMGLGPESEHAQRQMAQRAKRLGNVVDFRPHSDPDGEPDGAMKRAA